MTGLRHCITRWVQPIKNDVCVIFINCLLNFLVQPTNFYMHANVTDFLELYCILVFFQLVFSYCFILCYSLNSVNTQQDCIMTTHSGAAFWWCSSRSWLSAPECLLQFCSIQYLIRYLAKKFFDSVVFLETFISKLQWLTLLLIIKVVF
jgi:hypothetical protein